MPRTARIIAPGYPHHVVQRGNRRMNVFFKDDDFKLYLELMFEFTLRYEVEIWAYCLMDNHIHMIAVPHDETGLTRAVGEAHRRYSAAINRREGWTGHLWQGRYRSYVMDEAHTLAAARYIERNPVGARMVRRAEDYKWSSVHAHIKGKSDGLVKVEPLLNLVSDWARFLQADSMPDDKSIFVKHEASGWPLGADTFLCSVQKLTGRVCVPNKRGRPAKIIGSGGGT